jgi:hypothetical protein
MRKNRGVCAALVLFAVARVVGCTAATADPTEAPPGQTTRTPAEVSCSSSDQTCGPAANVCCGAAKFQQDLVSLPSGGSGPRVASADFIGYDVSCVSDPSACSGELNQLCDGPEDCQGGQSCCLTDGGSFYFKTTCLPLCSPIGSVGPGVLAQLCHDHTDCPSEFAACCVTRAAGPAPTFGYCVASSTASTARPPVTCDVP